MMGQRFRRRFELAFCNATERILNVFEIVLLTLKPLKTLLYSKDNLLIVEDIEVP